MNFYTLISYYGLHFLRVACLAAGGWIVGRVCAKILKQELMLLYKDDLVIDLLAQMARYVILFITGVTILYELNINISGLLGAAGVIGIAVGFAAQTSISNIISGLFLMIEHPFKLGDYIVCEDAEGKVTSINLFAVTLYTDDNKAVRIPHEKVLKSTIKNITGPQLYRHDVHIKIASNCDIDKVVHVIKNDLSQIPYYLSDPAPVVRVQEITGDYFDILIGVWALQIDRTQVKQQLLTDIYHLLTFVQVQLYSPDVCGIQKNSFLTNKDDNEKKITY